MGVEDRLDLGGEVVASLVEPLELSGEIGDDPALGRLGGQGDGLVAIELAALAALGGLMGAAVALACAGPLAVTALGSTAPRPGCRYSVFWASWWSPGGD